jgi:murein hydrolase activator
MTLSKFRKNKHLLSLMSILFLLLFIPQSFSAQNTSQKNSKKELELKKKKINDEIKEIDAMLKSTKAIKKTSLGNLVSLNMKLEKRKELIAAINAELNLLNKNIDLTEQEITQLKSNLEKLKAEYARMILSAQRQQDSYSRLMFIFSAGNFNQALMRLKYMQQYSVYRKKQADEIVSTQKELNMKLEELKESRDEKNLLLGNEVAQKDSLSKERSEQELVLNDLQKKEKELKNTLERKKQEGVELQLAIKRLIEEEIKRKAEEVAKAKAELAAKKAKEEKEKKQTKPKEEVVKIEPKSTNDAKEKIKEAPQYPELSDEAAALSNEFANNRGKLPWPITKGIVCEPYGEHEHPAIKGFMMINNGIEICSIKNAAARCVFDGEVTSVAVAPTGGKLVIIRHGEYLSVYTNLSNVNVKVGEKVKTKQTIGVVMSDEDDTKSAMNFQIWKGQKTMDPSGWLNRGAL